MADIKRVALVLVDTDDVPAERCEDRLRHFAHFQCIGGFLELRHEPVAAALAERTTVGARNAVHGFALGNVFELGASCDLRTNLVDTSLGARRIVRRHRARDAHERQHGATRSVKTLLVPFVELPNLVVRDSHDRVRETLRMHNYVTHLCRVVTVLIDLPQSRVGYIDVGSDLIEELLLRDL